MFRGTWRHYPMPDHNPPRFEQIIEFCNDVEAFLRQDFDNTIVVHCKAVCCCVNMIDVVIMLA